MFGVQVFVWTSINKNAGFWQRLKQYLVDGNTGHCALKITIPQNPSNNELVAHFCKNEKGETLIPHFNVQTNVTGKWVDPASGKTHYFPRSVPSWEIYFSWWPGKLGLEHIDKRIANLEQGAVEYEPKWESYLDVKYRLKQHGPLQRWIGKTLTNMLFGKPKLVAQGIEIIVHPHPQSSEWINKIAKANKKYEAINEKYAAYMQKIQKTHFEIRRLQAKLEEETTPITIFLSLFVEDNALQQRKTRITKKLQTIQNHLAKMQNESNELFLLKNKLKERLQLLEMEFFTKVASMGLNPTETFTFPIEEENECGLAVKPMLKMMGHIVKEGVFDILNHNCSSTLYEIVMAGLQADMSKEMRELPQSLVETPNTLSHFLHILRQQFQSKQIAKVNAQLEKDNSDESKEASKPPVRMSAQIKRTFKVAHNHPKTRSTAFKLH